MHTATAVPSPTKIERRETALRARRAFAMGLSDDERAELEARLRRRVLPRLDDAATVAAYHPMRAEIDPTPILGAVAAGGGIGLLPWFAGRDDVMTFRRGPAAVVGPWGIMQPSGDAAAVRPDIVLVPLVAADTACNRIGHGKGHYDGALTQLRATGRLRAIGLAWDMQILDGEIPTDPWDVPLDAIATPDRWIERSI